MADPVCAQKAPYAVDVEEGKTYYYCACGRTGGQPFCDGSHKGTGMAPTPVTAEKTGKAYFCGCRSNGAKPFCDGSHKAL